jgi:hypothetical protein
VVTAIRVTVVPLPSQSTKATEPVDDLAMDQPSGEGSHLVSLLCVANGRNSSGCLRTRLAA